MRELLTVGSGLSNEGLSENIIESSLDGIYVFDCECRYTFWNPGMERLSGMSRSQVLGRCAFDVFPFLKETGSDRFFFEALSGQTVFAKDRIFSIPETNRRGFFEGHYHPLLDSSGKIIGGYAIIRDITERKLAEEALRASESKYRTLMEQASDGIHTYDLEGNFIDVNSKLCEMLGYTREELLRLNVRDLIPTEELATAPLRIEELRAGKTIIRERSVRRKDGTSMSVEISGKMLQSGVLQAIIRDITERKRAEKALRQLSNKIERQLHRFDTVASSVQDFIYMFDLQGRFTYINQPLLDLWQKTFEQAVGRNFYELDYPADLAEKLQRQIQEVITSRGPLKDETPYTSAFGTRAYEYIFVPLIGSDGAVEAVAGVTRDVTERKRAEEELLSAREGLEQRVRERTNELAQANEALHAEAIVRQQAEEERKELLRLLLGAQEDERCRIARELHDQMGQHLTALTWELKALESSEIERDYARERLHQLQKLTEELIQQVHTLAWRLRPAALDDLGLQVALHNYVEQWAERSRIVVKLHLSGIGNQRFAPHLETTVYRIVQEALTNVLKHAEADRVNLSLEQRLEQLFVIVEDNGRGFDVEAVTTVPVKERRLGLLGMRERVAQVSGTLNLESTPGVGTLVMVRIPLSSNGNGDSRHD